MGYYLPQKSYLKPRLRSKVSNSILALTASVITVFASILIFASLQFGENKKALATENVNSNKIVAFDSPDIENFIPVIENTGKIDFPVMLAFYYVNLNEDATVDIKWASVSEYKNELFIIEKSVNNSEFKEIYNVEGSGTTKESHDYAYTDVETPEGLVFYRLKQVSSNGETSYIGLEKAEKQDAKKDADLYIEGIGPEPFVKNFDIHYFSDIEAGVSVELIDRNGLRVFKSYTNAEKGLNTCRFLNGEELTDEFYTLKISTANATYSKKIRRKI